MKRSIAKATGIPTTKSGRRRKLDSITGQMMLALIIFGSLVYVFSEAAGV